MTPRPIARHRQLLRADAGAAGFSGCSRFLLPGTTNRSRPQRRLVHQDLTHIVSIQLENLHYHHHSSRSNANMSPLAPAPPRSFAFKSDASVTPWAVTLQRWLQERDPESKLDGIATGAAVFNADNKVLLVQRASHDSMPNLWEVPGGAVDPEDETILHGAARELWEEAGLVLTRINRFIPEGGQDNGFDIRFEDVGYRFTNRTGTRKFCRFAFDAEVESCDKVNLDPNEHQDYAWASEEEVRAEKIGDRAIPLTGPAGLAMLLTAFRLRREGSKIGA
ncbi:NUDIX hydrolase domain-like protein [Cercophora newfieldiana]|uniref:NUDIX hydrolase domain-like protein n=1 Tax=Cercophora newfieldiana TaxID=92897 RepID=A0AA40CRJ4_9PEZI|nr:NUDIX hydrolase domain-like protein [Cercophora newfieldiana]